MREILFRGKKKNGTDTGKWVYGSLIQTIDGTCSIWSEDIVDDVEIEPKTVGQYTGLMDTHGKKIFEFDVVQDITYPYIIGVVKFMTGTFDSGIYKYNGWVIQDIDGNIDMSPLLQYEKESIDRFEIIGNIFDNSELMGNK